MSEVLARIRENAKLYPKRTAYKTAVPTENGYEDIEMTWEDLERKSNQLSFFWREIYQQKSR